MKEIEIRAIIDKPAVVQERLLEIGFEYQGSSMQKDIIFDKVDASLFKSGRKIRVRLEGDSAELTYKGPFEGTSEASRRSELNISIPPEQVDDLALLLTAIGYPICFTFLKKRTVFLRNKIKVTFDDWPILGHLMEIEGDEMDVRDLAAKVAPGIQFSNYRLGELFLRAESVAGISLKELQRQYEESNRVSLGRLELLLR